jgi:aryl-alcohol dehydrogenase-like predicted oxidoreductase
MERRTLGRTGLSVSALGFGCGNVGGLMVRGAPAERERAVARALELGINYFDTAPAYGDGLSETHLGLALRALQADVHVGTKFRLDPGDFTDPAAAITRSLETSLRRLGRERVELFQLHNRIGPGRGGDALSVADVLEMVVPAADKLRTQGKLGWIGITAMGQPAAIHRVLDAGVVDTAQVFYNLLNPTAGGAVPVDLPGGAPDFQRLLPRAGALGVGTIVVRVFAAGALSGAEARHPVAVPSVAPIASGPDYGDDVQRARRLRFLVDEGHASSLVEAALRFALTSDAVSTVLLGYSSLEHLEQAAAAVARGPLTPVALARLDALWHVKGTGAR